MARVKRMPAKIVQERIRGSSERSAPNREPPGCYLPIPKPLSPTEIEAALKQLTGWSCQQGTLHRQFSFSSFEKALAFFSGLALKGKAVGHHPQESGLYNCVNVDLTTPEAGGITELDLKLAREADNIASLLH